MNSFIERFIVKKQTEDTDLTLSLLACSLSITLNRVLLSNTIREKGSKQFKKSLTIKYIYTSFKI